MQRGKNMQVICTTFYRTIYVTLSKSQSSILVDLWNSIVPYRTGEDIHLPMHAWLD